MRKVLFVIVAMLLVGCGGSDGDVGNNGGNTAGKPAGNTAGKPEKPAGNSGGGSSGSSSGSKGPSPQLLALQQAVDGHHIFLFLNTTQDYVDKQVDSKKETLDVKVSQTFTGSDISCKALGFTEIKEEVKDKDKVKDYKTVMLYSKTTDNLKCQQTIFYNGNDDFGNTNFIISAVAKQ